MKEYIIIASNGAEVIDGTPEAADRIAAMEYLEKKNRRSYRKKAEHRKKMQKNPFWKLACFCGFV